MPTMEPSTKQRRRAEAATCFVSTGCSAAEALLARPRAVPQGLIAACHCRKAVQRQAEHHRAAGGRRLAAPASGPGVCALVSIA